MGEIAIAGVRVGHLTRDDTGVTVVLLPDGAVGSAEVRGGAPASRELDALHPLRTVARVDAIVFAGGSAFGLAAADGVTRALAARGRGFPTAGGPVPIVPAACIYDLTVATGAPPTSDDGQLALDDAERAGEATFGAVGAGAGATVGKWRGRAGAVPGGIGYAHTRVDAASVAAIAVVNAVGDIRAADGGLLAGSTLDSEAFPVAAPFEDPGLGENTTLVAVLTDATCDKPSCALLAQSAHDGFARALHPTHTRHDGDIAIAVATGRAESSIDRLRVAATEVVADAIRAAAR